jgi:hypothetical protein
MKQVFAEAKVESLETIQQALFQSASLFFQKELFRRTGNLLAVEGML